MSTPQLRELAEDLVRNGFAGHELAVRNVVRAAREAGPTRVSRILVDVLADPAQPEVARLRAFGRIAVALTSSTGDPVGRDAAA
jgi:hypothetical protein